MPDTELTIRRLQPDELAVAADLVSRAFVDEPGNVRLLPDRAERLAIGRVQAAARLRRSLRTGYTFGAFDPGGGLVGVALWVPPGAAGPSGRDVSAALRDLAPQWRTAVRAAGRAVRLAARGPGQAARVLRTAAAARRDASDAAAWYLAILATDPDHQRRGVGRALVEAMLARCDADGLPTWLETTEDENLAYYRRFGYEVTAAVEAGPAFPDHWVMVREPSRRGT